MPLDILKGKAVPAIVGAGLSLFFIKSGLLFLFFLVPFGVLAYKYGRDITWKGLLLAILGNAVISIMEASAKSVPLASSMWDFFYFVIMASIFVWIIAPPDMFVPKLSGVARLITGSLAGALFLSILLFRIMASPGFLDFLDSWIGFLASSNRSNVARFALFDAMTAEDFLLFMKAIIVRGGSLITCVFMFFICRQVSVILANINFGSKTGAGGTKKINSSAVNILSGFHVIPELIWILSLSLLLVVLTRILRLEVPEIILWNILILCFMLYLAQGLGVLQFFLTKPSTPHSLRFFLVILMVVLMFSPFINALLFGGFFLLGIVENWIPMRIPKKNGPPSTPEAGDNG